MRFLVALKALTSKRCELLKTGCSLRLLVASCRIAPRQPLPPLKTLKL